MTTDTELSSPNLKKRKSVSHSFSPEPVKKSRAEDTREKGNDDNRKSKKSSSTYHHSRERKHRRRYEDLDRPLSGEDNEYEYSRYYGEDQPKRNNSDKYWNKYPKRDENIVGKRYYEAEEKKIKDKDENKKKEEREKRKNNVDLLTKTGGAYIPPAKLRMMQAEITDKTSSAYQRIAWEALKKSIHGFINKVNTSNIGIISRELLHENIVRGRGLLAKSLIQAQAASPTFTNVYAALIAVINSKFPSIGNLLLKRLVLQFKRGYKQNNKVVCISAATFVAHLVNQRVAHEILALEILTLLVETPTDDSVEVAISFLKECGQKLTEVSSKGINAIFEMLRNILHEGQLEKRIQYMIEVMFQVRKDGFKDHVAITEELDLVEEEYQVTHLISLDSVEANESEDILNVFKFDEKYEENEGKYKTLSRGILDQSDSGSDSERDDDDDDENNDDSDDDYNDDDENVGNTEKNDLIIDNTETNLIALRRTIYLTIQSSLDFEESAHKLMKMELKPGQEIELCHMFLDCCAEQRTYEKFYGLLAQRFCEVNNVYVEPFQKIFKDTYATTHRLDTNKLRNVSKFFAHLMFTDAISWEVLDVMKLNEEDTNSSNRIFIKILFQELAEYIGLEKLNARLKDDTLQANFSGLFPRDDPKNTRFAINFFTSIGLGGLTAELREHLKNAPKAKIVGVPEKTTSSSSSSDSSSSESSSNDDSTSDSSTSSSDSSSEDKKRKSKNKRKHYKERKERNKEENIKKNNKRVDMKRDGSSMNSRREEEINYERRHDKRRDRDEEDRRNRKYNDSNRGHKNTRDRY